MSLTEWIPIAASCIAIVGAAAAILRDRKKPDLDEAQAKSALVNSDSVKQQIRKMSDESNARRDLRVLDLEEWADKMRPWTYQVRDRYERLQELVKDMLWAEGKKMPEDMGLPEPPPFPPPRPL